MKATDSVKPLPTDWLCCLLSLLYRTPASNSQIFDSVIVVVDKRVLDKKIGNRIKQMKHTRDVINPAQGTSQQLKTFLQSGKSMIITTIRKFPEVHNSITQLKNRSFAVIISEAHSSLSGETFRHHRSSLLKSVLDEYQIGEDNEDLTTVDKLSMEKINLTEEQAHICYFGFSSSPGNNTFELYEARNEDGTLESYGFISMKQKYAGRIYPGCSSSLLYL